MWNRRGVALGLVIITAVIFSVAAFAALTVALSGKRQSEQFHEQRFQARYAAEAGLVWAFQKLWAVPTFSSPAGNTDVTVDGVAVDVIIDPCPSPPTPCPSRTLQAKVNY